jgi:hypothetical protein
MDEPIFIVGWPRSGSTLLAQIVSAHPNLCCGVETHLFEKVGARMLDRLLRERNWIEKLARHLSSIELARQSILSLYGHSICSFEDSLSRNERSINGVLKALYSKLLERESSKRIIEKTPNHLKHLQEIREHFPTSPIIRIVRDPRDSALSMPKLDWVSGTTEAAVIIERWFRHSDSFFAGDRRSMTIRYEDLLANCGQVISEVFMFVGESVDLSVLEKRLKVDTLQSQNEVWKKDTLNIIDPSAAYRWKLKCDEFGGGIDVVDSLCQSVIVRFSYDVRKSSPVAPEMKRHDGYLEGFVAALYENLPMDVFHGDRPEEISIVFGVKWRKNIIRFNVGEMRRAIRLLFQGCLSLRVRFYCVSS